MTIRELLSNKKYFKIKKKLISKKIDKELDYKLVDFLIYESNKIDESYINDKSFMSFLDDKMCEFIRKRDYIPDRLYKVIKEDIDINSSNAERYESHNKLNKSIDCLLNNCLFPKSIGTMITNNLNQIFNFGLITIFTEYTDCDYILNPNLTNVDGFYDKYIYAIDRYVTKICKDKYDIYRKTNEDIYRFNCDMNSFYIYELVDHIVQFFPSSELLKEDTIKIISKYKTRFEKQLFEKMSEDDKKLIYLLEKYIFNGIAIDNWFTSHFIKIPENVIEFIFDNYLELICINTEDIFILLENVEKIYGTKYLDKIITCIDGNKEYFLNSMVMPIVDKKNINVYKDAKEIVRLIVDEIMENENIKHYEDIKRIGIGRSSRVYKIGNKVLKIGRAKMRLTLNYPNNPYIIKPLMRKIIKFGLDEVIFEVQEYVPSYKPTKEEKEKLYLNLRKLGIIWIDPNSTNFSKLEKDNKIYWNKRLEPSDEALNLTSGVSSDIMLHKDDIVINDADAFYTPFCDRIRGIKTDITIIKDVYDFEKKYLKSKKII